MELSDVEYVVYSGYDIIGNALSQLGLIFSDTGYQGLFAVAAVVGIVLFIMMFQFKKVSGAQVSPLAWAIPLIVSLAIYIAFFQKTGNITLYDEQTGYQSTYSNIPLGIVATAGITNKVERNLIDIVNTASGSFYQESAGGKGMEIILYLIQNGVSMGGELDMSMQRYMKDCFLFELSRPGTTLNPAKIKSGETTFSDALASSANPYVFTVTYINAASASGDEVSCTDAWTKISSLLGNTTTVDKYILGPTCNAAGFDSSDTTIFDNCKTILKNHLQWINSASGSKYSTGSTVDLSTFATRVYIANLLYEVVRQGQVVPFSDYQIFTRSGTEISVLNQWIPSIKALLTAITISITPLLLIFIPTPLAGKAFALIFGLFTWNAMWGVTDAIAHNAVVYQISNIFEKYRASIDSTNGIGYDGVFLMSDPAVRTLSLLGYMRTSAMVFATVLTGVLIKFGGYAITSFAQGLTGMVSSTSSETANKVVNPVGAAQTMDSAASSIGSLNIAASHSIGERAYAATSAMKWSLFEGLEKGRAISSFGESAVRKAIGASMSYNIGHGLRMNELPGGAFQLGRDAVTSQYVGIQEGVGAFNAYGGDHELMRRVGGIKTDRYVGDSLAFEKIAKEYGFSDVRQAAQALGEITHGEGFAHTASVRDFASRYGMSNQQALQFIANTRMASNEATFKAFGGDVRAYGKFLENNMDLSIGQQQGIIRAAQKAGIDLRDYGKTTSFMESMKKVGAIDAYKKGKITDKDLIDIGKVAVLKEAGDADAARRIEEATGKDPREFVGYIRSSEGVNELAKFEMRQRMAEMLGFGNDLRGMYEYLKQSQGIDEVVLSPGMAKELNKHMHKAGFTEFRAKAGDVVKFGYDESTGTISMAHSTGGGKSESYNLDMARTGTDRQDLDINKRIKDHMNVEKGGGTEITMVTPDGVKTGYLTYDPKLKRPVLVAGQEKYGIDKYMVVDQPEKRDASGKIVQPAGKVVQSVTVDPKTGEVVQGKNVSLLITEGEIQFGGRTFKGTLYQDTRTGNKLFIDGKSGNFWTITEMEDAWTMHRSFEGRGEYFSSVATNIFGKEAGAIVSNTEKGLGEVTGVISSARAIRSLGSGSSRSSNPKTFSGKPMSSGEERNSIIKPASKYTNIKNIQKQ